MTERLAGEAFGDIVQNELTTDRARDNVAVIDVVRHTRHFLFVILERNTYASSIKHIHVNNMCLENKHIIYIISSDQNYLRGRLNVKCIIQETAEARPLKEDLKI